MVFFDNNINLVYIMLILKKNLIKPNIQIFYILI